MRSPVSSSGAGVLAVLTLLAAVVAVQARAAPRRQLPLHLLSVAAALRDAEAALSSDAEQLLTSEAEQLLTSEAGALSRERQEQEAPLERPPLPGPDSADSAAAEFAEYSGRMLRPRRSKKGRRRGGLRLDREQHQLWLRSGECRKTAEGEEQFFCPSPDSRGAWRCTTAGSLCDGKRDCPGGEDEQGTACLFYKAISDKLSSVANHVLKLKSHHRDGGR